MQGAVLTNLRLWDADNEKSQVKIIKARNANNTRVGILAMNISGDGKTIAAGTSNAYEAVGTSQVRTELTMFQLVRTDRCSSGLQRARMHAPDRCAWFPDD